MEDTSLARFTKAIRSGNQYNIRTIGLNGKKGSFKVSKSKGLGTPPDTPKFMEAEKAKIPRTPDNEGTSLKKSLENSSESKEGSGSIKEDTREARDSRTQLTLEILKHQMIELNYEILINFTHLRDKLDHLNERIDYFKQSNDEVLITKAKELKDDKTSNLGFFITATCLLTPITVCAIILCKEIHHV